jgi:hypothetical protein
MARHRNRRLTVEEIANGSGLSVRSVIRISKLKSWDGVRVGVAAKYMAACGVDPFHTKRLKEYLRVHGADLPHVDSPRVRRYFAKLAAQ